MCKGVFGFVKMYTLQQIVLKVKANDQTQEQSLCYVTMYWTSPFDLIIDFKFDKTTTKK